MRFRFCGDLDCPDWVLLEISILSTMETQKIALITKQILTSCLLGKFEEADLIKIAEQNEDGLSELKGIVAVIHYIISNAAKYDVDEQSLSQEIQQLGLPKMNADIISSSYRDNKDSLRDKFTADSYRVSKVISSSWRLDHIIATSDTDESECILNLNMKIDSKPDSIKNDGGRFQNLAFEIEENKLDVLIKELTVAKKMLESIDN